MEITRIRNGKVETYTRKKNKEVNYDVKKTLRFNSEEYDLFQQKIKENNETMNDVIRKLINNYVREN